MLYNQKSGIICSVHVTSICFVVVTVIECFAMVGCILRIRKFYSSLGHSSVSELTV
jgi:hypothetical protein